MAKKIFTYKGKTLEQLKQLSMKELAMIVDASARRKIKRGFTEAEKTLLENVSKKDYIKTHCRDMFILPVMVGKKIGVYNGKEFPGIEIKEEMIGHRLGEFALTRKPVKHSAPGIGASKSTLHATAGAKG